jgi:heat shock protein HslJ
MRREKLRTLALLACLALAVAFGAARTAAAQVSQPAGSTGQESLLIGSQWNLSELNGKPVSCGAFDCYLTLRRNANIDGGAAGELVVSPDCGNQLTGSYAPKGDSLHLVVMTSTLVACFIPAQQSKIGSTYQPELFLKALSATSHFKIQGSTLELLNNGGVVLARLNAGKPR